MYKIVQTNNCYSRISRNCAKADRYKTRFFHAKFRDERAKAMFDTYPASRCTTQNMYTCVCAGLVVIFLLRTALGSLKEERKKERR